MKQITEDYVSYETAVLLKEKGFDEMTNYHYDKDDKLLYGEGDVWLSNSDMEANEYNGYSAPTQSLALKWLREVKKIHISLYATFLGLQEEGCVPEKITYTYNILNANEPFHFFDEYDECDMNPPQFNSYEETVEVAILYVLKNLI